MPRKFKKNKCISDSESEEEDSISSKEESDSSVDIDDLSPVRKNTSVSDEESDSTHPKKNDSCESDSSPHEENSSISINNLSISSLGTPQKRSSGIVPQERRTERDYNANRFSHTSLRSAIEDSKNSENNDVIVMESSTSMINETNCIIEDSCNGSGDNLNGKNSSKNERIIVMDSSASEIDESKSVIEDSCNETGDNFSGNKSKINPIEEIEIVETSRRSIDSLSKITLGSSSSSRFELSDASQSSLHSNSSLDERRSLERQIADKKTAYQNILRAVKTCDPNKLKDGGKLLKDKLVKCEEEIKELKEKLKSIATENSNDSSIEKQSIKSSMLSTSDQITSNLGKKAMQTHRVQAALTVDALVTLHSSLETCPAEDVLEDDPTGLRSKLMPHQKYALSWLLWREKQIPPAGILADDMGLGKTLTMIALVLRAEEYKKNRNDEKEEGAPFLVDNVRMYHGKTLVICPVTLLGQWQGQVKQHCKSQVLSTLIHHGKPRELQAKKLAAHDLVITSYGVVVEENKYITDVKKGALFRVKWERVILDEGHIIKNYKTKTAQAVYELDAKYRWCLTGTPVQNKEIDMYSLLKFLRCSPFDELAFWKRWVDNKTANGVQRLNTVVKSILLRRTKDDLKILGELQELPNKNSITVNVKLDEEEQTVYHTVLHFSKTLLAEYILQEQNKYGFVSDELRNEHRELLNSANRIKTTEIFVLLLRLRQICCLPALIHAMLEKDSCMEDGIDPEDDPILKDLTSHIGRMSVTGSDHVTNDLEENKKVLIDSNPIFRVNRASTKIQTVLGIVKESLEAGDKIVIVSQWANLLEKLKIHIVSLKIETVVLNGSVPVKFRPQIIDSFNNPDSNVKVMLLSLTAGGVGLNLTGGNRLIIFEPHWNPQLESQACDRVYRVGQKKPVYIYKVICENTIEEKILLLQKKKLELAKTILKGELKMNRAKLTLADLKILFDIHDK